MGCQRWGAALAVACALAVTAGPALPADAAGPDGLRLIAVDQSDLPQVRLVAVVPPMLSSARLGAGSFAVRQGGQSLSPTVNRLADKDLEVVLVADRSTNTAALRQELAAATELAHLLPDTVRISTLDPNTGDVTSLARTAVLTSLSSVTPDPRSSTAGALASAAVSTPATARRAFVLFTTCPSRDIGGDADQLSASLGLHDQQLDVVQLGRSCPAGLPNAARRSGGSAAVARTPTMIANAADQIGRELLGEYRVSFRLTEGRSVPTTVRVAGDDVDADATLPLDAPTDDRHSTTLVVLLSGGGAVIVALLAGAAFFLWRSRRSALA